MAKKVIITESYLHDIGDAIRGKLKTEDTYEPSEMASAIDSIPAGAGLTFNVSSQEVTDFPHGEPTTSFDATNLSFIGTAEVRT